MAAMSAALHPNDMLEKRLRITAELGKQRKRQAPSAVRRALISRDPGKQPNSICQLVSRQGKPAAAGTGSSPVSYSSRLLLPVAR